MRCNWDRWFLFLHITILRRYLGLYRKFGDSTGFHFPGFECHISTWSAWLGMLIIAVSFQLLSRCTMISRRPIFNFLRTYGTAARSPRLQEWYDILISALSKIFDPYLTVFSLVIISDLPGTERVSRGLSSSALSHQTFLGEILASTPDVRSAHRGLGNVIALSAASLEDVQQQLNEHSYTRMVSAKHGWGPRKELTSRDWRAFGICHLPGSGLSRQSIPARCVARMTEGLIA